MIDVGYHQDIVRLIIAYCLAGGFLFTLILTCLSLCGWVEFRHDEQQKWLFRTLIGELVIVAVAFFADFIEFNPSKAFEAVIAERQLDAIEEFQAASGAYYNIWWDLVSENYQNKPSTDLWEKFTGPEGLDRAKLAFSKLNSLLGGEMDSLMHDQWRPAADKLRDLNNQWYDTRGQGRPMPWTEYQESDEFTSARDGYKAIEQQVIDVAHGLLRAAGEDGVDD